MLKNVILMSYPGRYGTYFFNISGVKDAFLTNVILQACQLAGIVCMFVSIRFIGRRAILLIGGTAMTICMFMVAIVGTASPGTDAASKSLVSFCCLYGFFFTWSWGSVGWVVTSEIASTTLRSRTQSLATTTSWIGTLLINIVLPYLINTDEANLGVKVRILNHLSDPSLNMLGWIHFWSSLSIRDRLGCVRGTRNER